MSTIRPLSLILVCGALFQVTAQPLIREGMLPQGENIRAGVVYDIERSIRGGDDYHGFTVSYASEIYPLDQMVATYTHLVPEQSTMQQLMLSIEEYWPLTETLTSYGAAGGGYIWTDTDTSVPITSHGWFGKLGAGILYHLSPTYDLFAELAYQVSNEDLWRDGATGVKSNNSQLIFGVRMNY
jgi:hypothetical protein